MSLEKYEPIVARWMDAGYRCQDIGLALDLHPMTVRRVNYGLAKSFGRKRLPQAWSRILSAKEWIAPNLRPAYRKIRDMIQGDPSLTPEALRIPFNWIGHERMSRWWLIEYSKARVRKLVLGLDLQFQRGDFEVGKFCLHKVVREQ